MKYVLIAILTLLSACGGGSSGGENLHQDNETPPNPSPTPTVATKFALTINAESLTTQGLPSGTEITILLFGLGTYLDHSVSLDDPSTTFENLLPGTYQVLVEVTYEGVTINSTSRDVHLAGYDFTYTIPIEINRANLSIDVFASMNYSFLTGSYKGNARKFSGGDCFESSFISSFNNASTDTTIQVGDDFMIITFEVFPEPTIIMSGTFDDSSGYLAASGTYQSSDFTSGTWEIAQFQSPKDGIVFMEVAFTRTDSCATTWDISGLK